MADTASDFGTWLGDLETKAGFLLTPIFPTLSPFVVDMGLSQRHTGGVLFPPVVAAGEATGAAIEAGAKSVVDAAAAVGDGISSAFGTLKVVLIVGAVVGGMVLVARARK